MYMYVCLLSSDFTDSARPWVASGRGECSAVAIVLRGSGCVALIDTEFMSSAGARRFAAALRVGDIGSREDAVHSAPPLPR